MPEQMNRTDAKEAVSLKSFPLLTLREELVLWPLEGFPSWQVFIRKIEFLKLLVVVVNSFLKVALHTHLVRLLPFSQPSIQDA
jgi:hypothetical protein